MNNVMVLVAKSKMSLDSETIVLTALVPEDVEFLYSMLDNYSPSIPVHCRQLSLLSTWSQ